MSNFINEEGYIYLVKDETQSLIGSAEKTETVRIDNETVEDVQYEFSLEEGKYIEVSRTQRHEPLPTPEPTAEEIQVQTLLNTEYLVVMSELDNL